ncbi:MAG: hypothetical protein HYT98_02560 [Candidatus Sungbacteria bacterium]|nr:hypothetical protein [Candidatus Sungbacteria bacterium]
MRKSTIIAIIIIAILAGGIAYFMFLQKKREAQPAPVIPAVPLSQPVAPPPPAPQSVISPPSPADPNLLWLNGERCPKKYFFLTDITKLDFGQFLIDAIKVQFVDDITCEDGERIAILLDAKIIGFSPTYKEFEFKLPTNTIKELEEAISKVEALSDPKIKYVSKIIRYDFRE